MGIQLRELSHRSRWKVFRLPLTACPARFYFSSPLGGYHASRNEVHFSRYCPRQSAPSGLGSSSRKTFHLPFPVCYRFSGRGGDVHKRSFGILREEKFFSKMSRWSVGHTHAERTIRRINSHLSLKSFMKRTWQNVLK